MDEEELPTASLTPEQWTAARMFVAQLGAAARGEEDDFDFDTIGMEIMPVEDMLLAMTAEHQISIGDALYAAKVLIWSLLNAFADEEGIDMQSAVGYLGTRLALVEPDG